MPADIINLRRVRRAKARVARESSAAENRRKFGRTGAEKAKEAVERDKSIRLIDAHRRDKD